MHFVGLDRNFWLACEQNHQPLGFSSEIVSHRQMHFLLRAQSTMRSYQVTKDKIYAYRMSIEVTIPWYCVLIETFGNAFRKIHAFDFSFMHWRFLTSAYFFVFSNYQIRNWYELTIHQLHSYLHVYVMIYFMIMFPETSF